MGFDITVDGATDCPVSNVLEKGRYVLEIKDLEPFNSQAGNTGIKVKFIADGVRIEKWFVLKDIKGDKHQMSYQWRQLLHAIGLRDKRATWSVSSEDVIGKKCLGDVIKKDDDNGIAKNEINFFSPIESQEAPIAGVPPEPEVGESTDKPQEPPKKQDKKKEEPIKVEGEDTEGL